MQQEAVVNPTLMSMSPLIGMLCEPLLSLSSLQRKQEMARQNFPPCDQDRDRDRCVFPPCSQCEATYSSHVSNTVAGVELRTLSYHVSHFVLL
jgi:hypothetical protein